MGDKGSRNLDPVKSTQDFEFETNSGRPSRVAPTPPMRSVAFLLLVRLKISNDRGFCLKMLGMVLGN